MTAVYIGSDFHLGHKNIAKFRDCILSEQENEELVLKAWKARVTKRDLVFLLGDIIFTKEKLNLLRELPGRKVLIRGNHDTLSTADYLTVFEEVHGLFRYKEFWLSHAPIHPQELRGKINLHGHVHYDDVKLPFHPALDVKMERDKRYFNCCVENMYKLNNGIVLMSIDQIRKRVYCDT